MEFLILLAVIIVIYVVIVNVGMALIRTLFRLPQRRGGSFFAHEAEDHYLGRAEDPNDPYSRKERNHFGMRR